MRLLVTEVTKMQHRLYCVATWRAATDAMLKAIKKEKGDWPVYQGRLIALWSYSGGEPERALETPSAWRRRKLTNSPAKARRRSA